MKCIFGVHPVLNAPEIILLSHFAWATASQNLKYSKVVTPNITVSMINMTLATANSMINMTLATANLDTFKLLTAKMFFWYTGTLPFAPLEYSTAPVLLVTIIAIALSY